jgi:transcriptional antiterminator NusG
VSEVVAGVGKRHWYIVHTYSGFEERVRETLRQRADALGFGDKIGEIRIPMETIVELKGGKKRETQRKFFPGYILVELALASRARPPRSSRGPSATSPARSKRSTSIATRSR